MSPKSSVKMRSRFSNLDLQRFALMAGLILVAAFVWMTLYPADALAKPKQLVYANWGGDAVRCMNEIFGKEFTKETGIEFVVDGTGPLEGKIKAMVDEKNVIWDVIEGDWWNLYRLGEKGMLEPIDYSIIDKSKVIAPYAEKYGVLTVTYAYPMAYDSSKFADDPPKNWADFWNVKKYPGKRAMYKYMVGVLEAALLADGVTPDKLYPLDVERALKKIREIKDHLVFWASGAESQQMFLQGEIVMGQLWNTRASILERDTKGRVKFTWNQAIFVPGPGIVPVGNPAGREWAMRFIAFMQDPGRQVELLKCLGYGPANPAANKLMSPDLKHINPSDPDNMKQMIPYDRKYYGEKYDDLLNKFLDMISE